MNEHDQYVHDEHGPPRRWVSPVVWSALGLLAFVIYEATTQPALASLTLCVKFGWEDFRTGVWLKRKDPYAARGRACRALYFASGLWKVALTATALFFVFAIIEGNQPPPPAGGQAKPPEPAFAVPFVTAFFAYSLLAVTACWAFWLAFFYDIKLWLHPAVHRDRRRGEWPPGMAFAGGKNRVGRLLFASLFLMFFSGILVLGVVAAVAANGIGQAAVRERFMAGFLFLILAVLPVGLLVLKAFLFRRLAAQSPQECWAPVAVQEPLFVQEYDYWVEGAES